MVNGSTSSTYGQRRDFTMGSSTSTQQASGIEEVNGFLASSKAVAEKILGINTSPSSTGNPSGVTVNNHYHGCGGPSYLYPGIFVIGNGGYRSRFRGRNDDKPSDATRAAVGTLGVVVGAVASFFIGKAFAQIDEAKGQLEDIKAFKKQVKQWDSSIPSDQPLEKDKMKGLKTIADCQKKILNKKINNVRFNLVVLAATVTSCALLVFGAIFASGALIIGGACGLTVSGGVFLAKFAYDSFSKADHRDAREIIKNVNDLEGVFC